MSAAGTAPDDRLAELKSKVRDAKLRAKSGEASVSNDAIRKLKDEIDGEKLKRKHESLAREGGEGVEPMSAQEIREQVEILREKVKTLSDSIGEPKKAE